MIKCEWMHLNGDITCLGRCENIFQSQELWKSSSHNYIMNTWSSPSINFVPCTMFRVISMLFLFCWEISEHIKGRVNVIYFFNSLNFYSLKIFKIMDISRKALNSFSIAFSTHFFTNINIIECYTMPIENCRSITREVKRIGLKIQLQNFKRRKIANFLAFFKYYLRIL